MNNFFYLYLFLMRYLFHVLHLARQNIIALITFENRWEVSVKATKNDRQSLTCVNNSGRWEVYLPKTIPLHEHMHPFKALNQVSGLKPCEELQSSWISMPLGRRSKTWVYQHLQWPGSKMVRLWKGFVFVGCQNRNKTFRYIRHTYFRYYQMSNFL